MHWLRKMEGARLAVAGLAVAAVLFIAVNVLANAAFRGDQVDLTEGQLYTVSDSTRKVLANLDQPVTLRLYYSQRLSEVAPRIGTYYTRVRDLLQQYVAMADGKLSLELLDPQPFSDVEDRAVADGLQGVPITQAGDTAYFGLVGTNSTDGRAIIPFFNLEREAFLEYDLTKLVYGLSHPDRPVLGVVSGLSNPRSPNNPHGGGLPPLMVFDQLSEFFTVENIGPESGDIPDNIKTLLVVDLDNIPDVMLRAIDRFVHRGGSALVFVDPVRESSSDPGQMPPSEPPSEDIAKLLAAWGLKMDQSKVAGDLDAARRVASGPSAIPGDYVAWMSLGRSNFDANDPIMANIERINIATAGILQPTGSSSIKITPLLETGPRAAPVDADKVRFTPDVQGIFRDFKPEGKPLILAARITGEAPLAFAKDASAADATPDAAKDAAKATTEKAPVNDGDKTAAASEKAEAPAKPVPAADLKPINVIVVADTDMLFDRFWLQSSDFFGQRINVPVAGNADFVANALEALSNAQALSGLRGRGTSYRPFTLVEELRRDAEMQYRAKEEELQQRLKDLEKQLDNVQQHGQSETGEIALSTEDRAAIERFRSEMLTVRKQLRDVQSALRSDIERLESWVKFTNIAAVPLVLCGVGGALAIVRRLRRRRARPEGKAPPLSSR